MRNTIAVVSAICAACALMLGIGTNAHAQSTGPSYYGKVGAALQSKIKLANSQYSNDDGGFEGSAFGRELGSSGSRGQIDSLGFNLGVGYYLKGGKKYGVGSMGAIELDYVSFSGDNAKQSSIGLKYIERFILGKNADSKSYVGLGLGLHFNSVELDGDSKKQTQVGFAAFYGYKLDPVSFVEFGLRYSPSLEGVRQDQFTLSFGRNF